MWAYSVFRTYPANDGADASSRNGVTIPGASTVYSLPWKAEDPWSAEVTTTGTLTGTWTLWGTNIRDANEANDADWVDITSLITVTNPAGSATQWAVNTGVTHMMKVRWKLVVASGAGSVFARVNVIHD